MIDIKKIEKLILLIDKFNIQKIEVQKGDNKVKIVGKYNKEYSRETTDDIYKKKQNNRQLKKNEVHKDFYENKILENKYIRSPMVGTFYNASSPNAEPFVSIGKLIKPGDTLCIIEAMKIMNEIESEVSGKIVKIMVENGNAVEYDQPIFIID